MRAVASHWTSAIALLSAGVCSCAGAETVYFDWFEYRGHDSVFERPLAKGHYRNPIIAGFYPDPSVTRAAGKFTISGTGRHRSKSRAN